MFTIRFVTDTAASVGSLLDECFDHEAGPADVYRRARRAGPVPSSQRLWGVMLPPELVPAAPN